MGTASPSGIRPLHLVAALVLLIFATLQWEAGFSSFFFLLAGSSFLIVSLTNSGFLTRPRIDALILWLEGVCLLLAGFRSFTTGKVLFPWLLILAAVYYSVQGYKKSGLN